MVEQHSRVVLVGLCGPRKLIAKGGDEIVLGCLKVHLGVSAKPSELIFDLTIKLHSQHYSPNYIYRHPRRGLLE